MRPRIIIASALIAGACHARDIFSKPFLEPERERPAISAEQNQMGHLVTERIIGEPIGGIANNEQASARMYSAGPRFQTGPSLERFPIVCVLENVNMRLGGAPCHHFPTKLLRNHAKMKFGFHGNG